MFEDAGFNDAYRKTYPDDSALTDLDNWEAFERDLGGLTDTEISLIIGLAFSLIYTLATWPLARYADRLNKGEFVARQTRELRFVVRPTQPSAQLGIV